jgi:RNA polymerase sigma-70 factor, ECF subfamily
MAAGDAHALQALSVRYARMLTALAWRFLANEAEAETVVGDVLWQVWSESKTFDPARGSVAAWLVALVRRRAISRLRTKQERGADSGQAPEAHDPALDAFEVQRAQVVRSAVAQLDPADRSALELAYFSDLSLAEIGQRLRLPPDAVRPTISRAVVRLSQALARPRK